ncbi:NmrA family protein [Peniophora sp. CONT]|nr:NmrA family protein [Peniophora sp. CONT]
MSGSRKLIAVTGATGQQGSSVVEFLLKDPETFTVRAITRNTSSPAAKALAQRGVEVVQADLASLEQTTKAFEGAYGVFGLTQFYEHGFDAEQLHGKNIVDAAKAAGVQHLVWSSVEGREGECGAISWRSKALIEDHIAKAGLPYVTYFHVPMYYQNFWTSFFAPAYDEEKGFNWSVPFLPDVPIFAFSVEDTGGLVVPAFKDPAKFNGVRIKTVTEFLSLRDLATQFSEVTGEKASLALEITREQFEASRHAPHPAAELMYLSWEYVIRAGPDSGVRDPEQTRSIYPQVKTYKEWVKDAPMVKELVAKLKAEAAAKKA